MVLASPLEKKTEGRGLSLFAATMELAELTTLELAARVISYLSLEDLLTYVAGGPMVSSLADAFAALASAALELLQPLLASTPLSLARAEPPAAPRARSPFAADADAERGAPPRCDGPALFESPPPLAPPPLGAARSLARALAELVLALLDAAASAGDALVLAPLDGACELTVRLLASAVPLPPGLLAAARVPPPAGPGAYVAEHERLLGDRHHRGVPPSPAPFP